jgi:hypothetical protein
MVLKTTGSHGGGASNGCDYELPLDETEMSGSTLRVAAGPVTSAAVRVVLDGKGGEMWTTQPQGPTSGFGHAFYILKIGVHAIIVDVKAFDARGRVVGEMKPDQLSERLMASPPPF